MTLTLGLCGCGVMGRRHILGLKKLSESGRIRIDLVAVSDPIAESAERAADLAAELLGRRPRVFTGLDGMQSALTLDVVAVVTSPRLHADLTIAALRRGSHVLVEKPIALTTRQGAAMVAAADATGRLIAVAENYRRDPVNRLAKALIDTGAIGRPTLAIQSSSGAGERVIITPWRHTRRGCGIAVDMGVHYTDLLEYYLGPIESVVGMNAIIDRERTDDAGNRHPVDAEDLTVGVARFANGALANLLMNLGGRGEGHFTRIIHGTGGSLAISADRSGKPLRLVVRRDGQDVEVAEADQLALVPEFRLDPTTAVLFGGDRLSSYELTWSEIDASLLAIEHEDLAEAILTGRQPEVSGADGLRSLALIYGFLESERLGRIVGTEELLRRTDLPYQAEIEAMVAGAA